MRAAFTLLEVVVALLVLEVSVLGIASMLVVASRTLASAEVLERAVAASEGVLDSLRTLPGAASGAAPFEAGEVWWSVGEGGAVVVGAVSHAGDTVLAVHSVLPAP